MLAKQGVSQGVLRGANWGIYSAWERHTESSSDGVWARLGEGRICPRYRGISPSVDPFSLLGMHALREFIRLSPLTALL